MATVTNLLIVLLYLALQFPLIVGLKIQSPTVIIICEPIVLVWSRGVPPYTISVEIPNQPYTLMWSNGTSCSWTPNVKAGTPVMFRVQDKSGASATSPVVVVDEGDDESCLEKALEGILHPTNVADLTATDSVWRMTTTAAASIRSSEPSNKPTSTSITHSSSSAMSRSTNLYMATSPTSESATPSSTNPASSPTDANQTNGKKSGMTIAIVVVVIVTILSSFICLGCIICRREAFKMRFRRLITPYDVIPEAEEQAQTKEMRNIIESTPIASRRSLQPLRLPQSFRDSVRTGRPGSWTPPPSYRE